MGREHLPAALPSMTRVAKTQNRKCPDMPNITCIKIAAMAFIAVCLPVTGMTETRLLQIPLSDEMPTRAGELVFLSGHHISLDDTRLGGISGIEIANDHFTAISDQAHWISGKITVDKDIITNIQIHNIQPVLDMSGNPLTGQNNEDSEGLSHFGQTWFISFERNHRIWRYASPDAAARPITFTLPGMENLVGNDGIEALVHLEDGRLLIFAEKAKQGSSTVWIQHPDGQQTRTVYYPKAEFSVVGATPLPDNSGILVLERAWSPEKSNRNRIMFVPAARLDNPDDGLMGQELASIHPPMNVDNYEAIAVNRGTAHSFVIDILSDDNFSTSQRSLWLRFGWTP